MLTGFFRVPYFSGRWSGIGSVMVGGVEVEGVRDDWTRDRSINLYWTASAMARAIVII
jgi:hypothetical protein